MKLLEKRFFRAVNDPMQMPGELNKLCDELIEAGGTVKPRKGPVVILVLADGEIHYVAGERGIWEYVFSGREV